MSKKNNISKRIRRTITTGAMATLGIGTVVGQNQDTTHIEMYDAIPVLQEGQTYEFGGQKGSFYRLNTINNIIEQYDAGTITPDTIFGDIEMDFFRDLNVPGVAEYSLTGRDGRAMVTIAQMLNNVDGGQEIGELTENESYLAFKALRKAGYLQNPGDRVKLLFPRTDQSSMAKINGKKGIIPAQDHVRGVIFEYKGEKGCNNCDEEETNNPRPYTAKSFSSTLELEALYSKEMSWLPQMGFTGKYGRFSFGLTGAYMHNSARDSIVFANIQGNGGTTDYTNTAKDFKSLGVKALYDITDRFSAGITGQRNFINEKISGSIKTVVGDGTTGLNQEVAKNTLHKNSSYNTWGLESQQKLGRRARLIEGVRFRNKAIEGAYLGFGYRISK